MEGRPHRVFDTLQVFSWFQKACAGTAGSSSAPRAAAWQGLHELSNTTPSLLLGLLLPWPLLFFPIKIIFFPLVISLSLGKLSVSY